jgi:ABC-type nickel/cobalt efflux system permease component RcnA
MWRLTLALVIVAALMLGLWGAGLLGDFSAWLRDSQREVQARLAGAIRALRAGEAGALAVFFAICFAYGLLHAAGPGHGKLVIGGYGVARRVTARKLALLSLISSLAQAAVAVAAVYLFVALLGLSRQVAAERVEGVIAPLGSAALLGLGLYLLWRGMRGLWRVYGRAADPAQGHVGAHAGHHHGDDPRHEDGHDHGHDHGPDCGCGHAHGPSVAQVEAAHSPREIIALVLGIALRPCTGAVFVLILTWQLGLALAGIAGAFVMGLGTALFTAFVALGSVAAREGAFGGLGLGHLARVLPWAEMAAGAMIAIGAAMALAGSF